MSGIKTHTIRMWERRYNILSPKRTKTNIRYYEDEDLSKLLSIRFLTENGYRISQISKMCPDTLESKIQALTDSTSKEDQHRFDGLTCAMLDLDEAKFETIFAGYCRDLGFDVTLSKVIFPFLEELGQLWDEGVLHIGHENFIIHQIKRKLFSAIESIEIRDDNAQRFLIFTPSSEEAELASYYLEYAVKKMGLKCLNLGAIDRTEDLAKINERFHPNFAFSILNVENPSISAEQHINNMLNALPEVTLFLTGFAAYNADIAPHERLQISGGLTDCLQKLQSLI